MVLKIKVEKSETGRNWVYYDNIERLSVTHHFDHKKSIPDACWIGQDRVDDEPMLLIALLKSGEEKSIMISPGSAYLLNDEGKTIERL